MSRQVRVQMLIGYLLLVGPFVFLPICSADAQTTNHRDIILSGLRHMRATVGEKMVVEANMHSAATAHLVTTLVEIVVDDAGRGPAPTLAPLATGPIIVDSAQSLHLRRPNLSENARVDVHT